MAKKIIILVCLAALALPIIVSAQNQTPNRFGSGVSPKVSSTIGAVKDVINRCPVIESKIQVKITNFDNVKIRHLEIYNRVRNRIASLTEKLAASGIDVTKLNYQLVVFDQKLKKFSDDYAIYINKLKESQAYVCGRSEGVFKTKLKEAKTALAQVHKDAVDIRTYYAQTIKPEINRIRTLIRNQKTTTTSATVTEPASIIDAENN